MNFMGRFKVKVNFTKRVNSVGILVPDPLMVNGFLFKFREDINPASRKERKTAQRHINAIIGELMGLMGKTELFYSIELNMMDGYYSIDFSKCCVAPLEKIIGESEGRMPMFFKANLYSAAVMLVGMLSGVIFAGMVYGMELVSNFLGLFGISWAKARSLNHPSYEKWDRYFSISAIIAFISLYIVKFSGLIENFEKSLYAVALAPILFTEANRLSEFIHGRKLRKAVQFLMDKTPQVEEKQG